MTFKLNVTRYGHVQSSRIFSNNTHLGMEGETPNYVRKYFNLSKTDVTKFFRDHLSCVKVNLGFIYKTTYN